MLIIKLTNKICPNPMLLEEHHMQTSHFKMLCTSRDKPLSFCRFVVRCTPRVHMLNISYKSIIKLHVYTRSHIYTFTCAFLENKVYFSNSGGGDDCTSSGCRSYSIHVHWVSEGCTKDHRVFYHFTKVFFTKILFMLIYNNTDHVSAIKYVILDTSV